MSNSNQDISNLLAFRDGDPVAADAVIDEQALADVTALRDELVNLPDVGVDESVWMTESARKSATSSTGARSVDSKWLRYPLSTAASVLVLSTVIALGIGNGVFAPEDGVPSLQATTTSSDLVALMDRSQDLERLAYDSPAWQQRPAVASASGLTVSPLGEFILFQLTEVDEAINQAGLDKELTTQLWQQRVNLLQAFLAEMESQNPGRFENNRSM